MRIDYETAKSVQGLRFLTDLEIENKNTKKTSFQLNGVKQEKITIEPAKNGLCLRFWRGFFENLS